MCLSPAIRVLAFGLLTGSVLASSQADGLAHGDTPAGESAGPSEEAVQAMARFEIPDGFAVDLFASEPLLANPVAFTFDVFGRAYVAETFRHSKGVTDIRSHMDWLEDDIAIKSVADRVAMFRKHEGDDGLEAGYAVETETVRRIEDTDGDGVGDSATLFAGGFTDPAVGIGAGVLARPLDGSGATEVWFTCIPDTWRLFDRDNDGVAEERTSQSNGYGLRVALLGHDLHGLVIGPDGRMYFSIGDRGFNVVTAEGVKLVRYGTGAVLRCELDGSDLEVFCDGLRNPQELVFDEVGNLFTLDNNSDGGDQARWTWLLKGSDTGWRQAYQWVGQPTSRGPWNEELMWKPFHAEQPAFILPPIANFTSGPSGLTIYPGTGFGEDWRGKFFVCDFRGAPGYSGIYAFDHSAQGAGFALGEPEKFVWNALPTDVEFGVDGNLYWSDWVTGWNQTGKGRIYRVAPEDRDAAEAAAVAETAEILQRLAAEGAGGSGSPEGREASLAAASGWTDEEMVGLYSHRDRRVRQEAQLALAHRALAEEDPVEGHRHLVPVLQRLRNPAENARERTARLHAIWTVWHVARRSSSLGKDLSKHLIGLLYDQDLEVAAQTCRVLGDLGWQPAGRRIPQLLIHESPRLRLYAAEALGGIGMADTSTAPLVELLENSGATDPWLRHAAIHSLERLGNPGDVHELFGHEMEHVRRAAAVVCRRWNDGAVAALLSDESALVRAEAARAIYDANIEEAMGDLASLLATAPARDTDHLTWRRAVHAARQVGTQASAVLLADFAVSSRGPLSVRAEAIDVLRSWAQPQTRDGILLDHRPLVAAAESDFQAVRLHPLMSSDFAAELNLRAMGADSVDHAPVALALIQLHRAVLAEHSSGVLETIARAESLGSEARRKAYSALIAQYGEETEELTSEILNEVGSPLRALAFGTLPEERAAKWLTEAAISGDLGDRAEAIRILANVGGAGEEAYAELGRKLEPTEPGLVDWLIGAEKHAAAPVQAVQASLLESWDKACEEGDALAGWRMCLEGGDAGRGARIFATKSETNCVKCHIVGSEGGSEAGPALDDVGARLEPESLLRSIVAPNAEIAEGFQSWILVADGEAFSGRIIEETAELVVLETAKKEQLEFTPDEIEVRRRDVSAMPGDISTHLSRAEMRDLIAYLKSLGTAPR